MNPDQLERAAYLAAHAVLAANTGAPHLACPGARRTYAVDTIAGVIKRVFEMHSDEMDAFTDWWERPSVAQIPTFSPSAQPVRNEKILPIRAETAVRVDQ